MMSGGGEVRVPLPTETEENGGERFYGATVNPGGDGGPPPAYADKPPPTYQEVTDVNAPPPSYDSLYGEFRQVRSPTGFAYFIRKLIGIVVGTVIAAILIAVISLIPIAMIVVGSMNLHNCRVEPYIPIYLIVGGVFGLLKSLTNFYYRMKAQREGEDRNPEENVNPNPFDGILNCFLLAWFIAGSVWVYRCYLPSFNSSAEDYCDKLTYYFTFSLITITYVMMGMFLWLMCCCGCLALCCGRNAESNE